MKNINLIAPCNVLGYGQVGYNILTNLDKVGYKVAYWPIGNIDYPLNEESKHKIQTAINNQSDFDCFAPSLRIWHQHDMAQSVGEGKRWGFPIFELNKFTEREKHHLGSLDGIFVTSEWAKNIVSEEIKDHNDFSEIYIAPLGVDRSVFFDSPPIVDEKYPYTFINIGKWEIRKGHDILIDAFHQAFKAEDNVQLLMMNHNPFLSREKAMEWEHMYVNSPLGRLNKIKIIHRVPSQKEVADLMRNAHCGVFPARAEGWNMELLEMMSVGRKVITTNYSAHTEFCTPENAELIPINKLEEAWDGIWFHGQGEWAALDKPEIDMLSSLMRKAYEDGKSASFNENGIHTARKLSWTHTCWVIQKGLEENG